MSFVEQQDILDTFEGLTKHLLKTILNKEIKEKFPQMPYKEAMLKYGNDKPDIRFEMLIHEMTSVVKGKGFNVFDSAGYIGGICFTGMSEYSRKQLDELTDFVKRPQIGSKGLIYCKYNPNGTLKSSVDKFYSEEDLKSWIGLFQAKPGDLLLVLAGDKKQALYALSELRLEMGNRLGLRNKKTYAPLWIVDFPLFEWDEETERFYAMHHPFTSPKTEDESLLEKNPVKVRANAYDLVINGVEIGGGSIRIHNDDLQKKMFNILGFTQEEAQSQFGFLINAFKYGAPPHGGIALGFDRLVALFAGLDSIRDVIAFPKNNAGRDVMIDSPSELSKEQLDELSLQIKRSK
jgi:aspartyl-tRNA synthetase